MGCNCKKLEKKEDINYINNNVQFKFKISDKIKLMIIFILFKIVSSINSAIVFLKKWKEVTE